MRKICLPGVMYLQLAAGITNAIVLDETSELLVNEPIEVYPNSDEQGKLIPYGLECSINFIHTEKDIPGLRKGHSLVGLSVIRHLTPELIANDK